MVVVLLDSVCNKGKVHLLKKEIFITTILSVFSDDNPLTRPVLSLDDLSTAEMVKLLEN